MKGVVFIAASTVLVIVPSVFRNELKPSTSVLDVSLIVSLVKWIFRNRKYLSCTSSVPAATLRLDEAAQKVEDVNERRRQAAIPLRDMRYLAERVRTAQVVADPVSADSIAFGSTVTFSRADGRVQTYRIVGEDEADPKVGSISYVSPIARLLLGKAVGDEAGAPGQILEVIAIV